MALNVAEKAQYADVVGPCSHNHEDVCSEYFRRVAAGSLETVDSLRAENARLQAALTEARACDSDELMVSEFEEGKRERDGYKALAERAIERGVWLWHHTWKRHLFMLGAEVERTDRAEALAERRKKELDALARRVHHRQEHPIAFEDCMRADCYDARVAIKES